MSPFQPSLCMFLTRDAFLEKSAVGTETMRAALFWTWKHLIPSTVFQFDKVSHVWIFKTCTTSPPKKRSKATEWHRFLFMLYEKPRTCLPLRKRPWLHHRELSPGLQHGTIATVTEVLFIKFYDRNVAIFPKKIRVNSIKKLGCYLEVKNFTAEACGVAWLCLLT